jgi:hypothetical protein
VGLSLVHMLGETETLKMNQAAQPVSLQELCNACKNTPSVRCGEQCIYRYFALIST